MTHKLGEVWIGGKGISIQVTDHFVYDVYPIVSLGTPDDPPNKPTAWGWVNHCREKMWWNKEIETAFLDLAKHGLYEISQDAE